MQTLSQIEDNAVPIIKSTLDSIKNYPERYALLYSYYSKLPPNENYYFHLVILAEVLTHQTIDKKQTYKDRLTQKHRKDLFRFLISKDILRRKGKSDEILNDYLQFSSIFELSQQEIKELVNVYFDPAVQSSETKKIDAFFKEKERGILNKLGTTNKDVSSPKRLLSSIGASSKNDLPTLQTDLESSPIAPQVLDSLMTILKLSSPSERYQKLLKFIQNDVSPFDAKRIDFHLKYVDNELQRIFLESFPPGQHSTNNIFSLLTKIGNGDQGLYEIQSLIKPRLVVRKRIIETFYKLLSAALKKDDNPGAGPEFEPVIKIINPGNWNKGMTADEVRVCLLIFLKLLKEFRLPKLARLGHRTMQMFSDLIDQGVRMSQNNYLDDFVEVFYKKLITDLEESPAAEPLDDIQNYYKSLEETIGAISGIKYKRDIENRLKEAQHKRKNNISMVHFLINDYRLKNPEGNISINDLARFDPAFDRNLHEEFKKIISNLEGFIDIPNSKSSHRAVVLGLGSYREFLNSQDNELKLFQILKWMGGYLNQGWGSGVYYRDLARELYLETYISIIQYAYKIKNLRTYHIGLPQLDYALFNAHVENSSWGDYKIDYFHRLGFSSKFLDNSKTLTVYMLSLHILVRKFKLDLVNNTERELIRELRRDNFKILKERAFKTNPQGVYERLAGDNVHVGDKSGNFEIYYISNPNEVRDLAENKFDVDKADEARITRTKYVYLLHSEIPCYLFKIGYDYPEWNNFLFGKMEGILYENTKGIIVANELFFRYIGYLPVLVYSGPVTALIEIAVDEATEKAIEVILPDSHVAQFLAGLALSFSPTPGVKDLRPPKANKILREQELEALSEFGTRLTDDASRFTHKVESQIDLNKLSAKIEINDIQSSYSGLDLRLVVNRVGEIIRRHGQKIPPEIMTLLENSTPFRRMVADADSVKLVEILDRTLSKSPPHYFQANSMGSKYEIWVWQKGKKQPVKLDGIVMDGNGKTWIGESKFTFRT